MSNVFDINKELIKAQIKYRPEDLKKIADRKELWNKMINDPSREIVDTTSIAAEFRDADLKEFTEDIVKGKIGYIYNLNICDDLLLDPIPAYTSYYELLEDKE